MQCSQELPISPDFMFFLRQALNDMVKSCAYIPTSIAGHSFCFMKFSFQLRPGNELFRMVIKIMGFGSRAFQIGGGTPSQIPCVTSDKIIARSESLVNLYLPQRVVRGITFHNGVHFITRENCLVQCLVHGMCSVNTSSYGGLSPRNLVVVV